MELIDRDEVYEFTLSPTESVRYRRIEQAEYGAIVRTSIVTDKTDQTDWELAITRTLMAGIISWEGFRFRGQLVTPNEATIAKLPTWFRTRLFNMIGHGLPDEAAKRIDPLAASPTT